MVIIVALAFFLLLFFIMKRQVGPAMLAMIAGLSVYALFGADLASFIHGLIDNANLNLIKNLIYVVLVIVFPLLLYIRSNRGGLHGIFRLAESVAFALLLTSLIAGILSEFLPFDTLSRDISSFIESIKGYVVAAGVLLAYLDILFYRTPLG